MKAAVFWICVLMSLATGATRRSSRPRNSSPTSSDSSTRRCRPRTAFARPVVSRATPTGSSRSTTTSTSLLEADRRIVATERVRYTNNSPDTLRFLWLQLDQNRFRDDSLAERSSAFADPSRRGPRVRTAAATSHRS